MPNNLIRIGGNHPALPHQKCAENKIPIDDTGFSDSSIVFFFIRAQIQRAHRIEKLITVSVTVIVTRPSECHGTLLPLHIAEHLSEDIMTIQIVTWRDCLDITTARCGEHLHHILHCAVILCTMQNGAVTAALLPEPQFNLRLRKIRRPVIADDDLKGTVHLLNDRRERCEKLLVIRLIAENTDGNVNLLFTGKYLFLIVASIRYTHVLMGSIIYTDR